MKLLPRFCYTTDDHGAPYYDAPVVSKVLAHQDAIAGILNQNKDVIYALQCGLVGKWGEWYYTDLYGDKGVTTSQQWTDRMSILDKWISALDTSIKVLVRYVGIKTTRFGVNATDPNAARVGFHNDAFLAQYDDYGTFSTFTNLALADAQAYLAKETLTNPMNGESASYNAEFSGGPYAKAALGKYHWDSLNPDYNKQVIGQWTSDELAEITRKLGYRLSLTSVTVPSLASGAAGTVSFTVQNTGYAPMRHEKQLYVTVENGGVFTRYPVSGGLVGIQPGYSATFTTTVTAPSAAGTFNLHLEMVDPLLPTRSEYAVRLANVETTYTATRNLFGALSVGGTSSGGDGTVVVSNLTTDTGDVLTTDTGDSLTI